MLRGRKLGVVVGLIFLVGFGSLLAEFTQAQARYPTRPIQLVVPWAAGGGTDRVARMVATLLEKELGQPVNVVNRTGGGGAIGHTAMATARPDGYTIGMATVEITMMHWLGLAQVTVNDMEAVAQVNFDPAGVTVRQDAPWQTLQDLLEDAKRNPGRYRASGTARGGIWDVARAGMLLTLGLPENTIPWVPSEGAAPALQELVAGGIQISFASLPENRSMIDAGRVRPLAVMADERDAIFPNTPTLKELGIDWTLGAWRGIVAPKGTPPEIVQVLEAALAKIVRSDEYVEFMKNNGFGIVWRDSKAFGDFMRESDRIMGEIMREVGLAR